jgi:hypothetical protein
MNFLLQFCAMSIRTTHQTSSLHTSHGQMQKTEQEDMYELILAEKSLVHRCHPS